MKYQDDLDYILDNANRFKRGGKMQRSSSQQRGWSALRSSAGSDYAKQATKQFMQQYANPETIKSNTKTAVERVNESRNSAREDRMLKKEKFIKKHTDPVMVETTKRAQQQLKDLGFYTAEVDGKWGKLSKKAQQKAFAAGYVLKDGKYQKYQPSVVSESDLKRLDATYPYGWVDANSSSGNPFNIARKALRSYVGHAGEDRKNFDEFITLNLNTPSGRARAAELAPKFGNLVHDKDGNLIDINNDLLSWMQQSMRARKDLTDLYAGREQTYNTFMINPDYASPNAIAAGVPTYTFRDPKMRKAWQREAANYVSRPEIPVGSNPVTGDSYALFNRHTVVKDENGGGRMADLWDFPLDLPGSNAVWIADTVPSNGSPTGWSNLHPSDEVKVKKNIIKVANMLKPVSPGSPTGPTP